MLSKLTLSVDNRVISKARNYARVHHTSISKIVEKCLSEIVAKEESAFEDYGELTKKLMSGVPFNSELSVKELLRENIEGKYK